MTSPTPRARSGSLSLGFGLGVGLLMLLAGCGRETIRVYEVAKDSPAPSKSPHSAHDTMVPPVTESLAWGDLPQGWSDRGAAGMRTANFTIAGPDQTQAEMAVMPFRRMGGSDLSFVNLWRSSLGLEEVNETRLASMVQPVDIGGQAGKFFDVMDPVAEGTEPPASRIVVAMLVRDDTTWFFKLAGDTALVQNQTPAFQDFLKSVTFQPAPSAQPAASDIARAPASSKESPRPQWDVPKNWEELPATTMVQAKFKAVGEGNKGVDVSVSVFPGDVGGLLANVNRWRSQVGLGPVSLEELDPILSSFDTPGGKVTLVDLAGTDNENGNPVRLVGAIVPRGGQTWFYKMMGNTEVASQEKNAFVKFIQSARYPNG